ncbi:cystathionine beta-synthase [Roseateles terrae]|uniref:Cystathionine beta-synthase n=2 Tax=Roseateles terrae TaxID=431060 RepID=A0ABR6GXI6_9BURK|nr:cystathionine beta-synthase [Roseateles terrae]
MTAIDTAAPRRAADPSSPSSAAQGSARGGAASAMHAPHARPAVLDLIGNTPLVPVRRLDTGPCELFLKLESQNPGGSIKDRIGLSMIEAAERDGLLPPGGTVVEATAGNTGLGLALVARAKGYRVVLVVPDKMSAEKVLQLKALGAEVHMTRSDVGKGHPDYYQDRAARLVQDIPGAWYADQFNNPANPLAHETTTGPEIWQQTGHRIDALVCGVGSGGTMTGLSRFFAKVRPGLDLVLADPEGSVLKDYVETGHYGEAGSWAVEGIGEDFIPPIADLSGVRHAYAVSDTESFATARELYRAEGILAGSSSGTLLAAALRYCRAQTTPRRVVTFVCDTGTRYLSKVYNDPWMFDQGLLQRAHLGDLRDLISRRTEDGAVVSVSPDDTLATAFSRMRQADVSQLPVLQQGRLVGLLDESDLLAQMHMDARHFKDPVTSAMSHDVQTLPPGAPLSALIEQLRRGLVAVIADDQRFYGLVTRFDLLNHLRKGLS